MSFTEWSNAKKKKEEESSKSPSVTKPTTSSGNSGMSFTEWSNTKTTGSAITGYNDKDAVSGWQKFQADQKKKREKEEEKSWFEKAIEMMGNSGDSTLPGSNITNVTNAYRKDTSYREPTENWSEQQKKDFGYLYGRNPDEAWSYAEKVNNSISRAETEKQKTAIVGSATDGFWKGAAHTAGAIATAPMGLADYLDNLAEYNARGRITEKPGVTPYDYSQTVTSSIANDLNGVDMFGVAHNVLPENIPIIGGKGWGDVYGLGTSIAQSALAGYTGGQIGTLVQFFGSAAASGVKEAKQRGATDEQALKLGTLSGAAEGLAEMVGVDNLLKIGSASTMRGLLMNLVKQGAAEGLEEGLTTLMNNFADQIVMQDKSNFNTMVRQLMENGMSEQEAKKKAWLTMANDLAFDMVAGFASGAIHAGPQTAYETYQTGREMRTTYGSSQQELVEQGLESAEGSLSHELATKFKEKLDAGHDLSGMELQQLVQANEQQFYAEDMENIQKAAGNRLAELGETGNVKAISEALAKQAAGQKLTRAERQIIANSQYGQRVANEMNPENISSGDFASGWAGQIGTNRINDQAYNEALMTLAQEAATPKAAQTNPAQQAQENRAIYGKVDTQKENGTQSHYEASESGETILQSTGEVVNIDGIATIKNGQMTFKLEDGRTVNAKDMSYGSQSEALVYEAVAKLDGIIDTETANKLSKHLLKLGDVSSDMYVNGIEQAYTYGYYGYGRDAMLGYNTLSATLTEKQRNVAYGLGEQYRAARTAADQKAVSKKERTTKKVSGKVHFDGDRNALTERQSASLSAMETVAEALGVQIYVFESQVGENGKRIGANGWYDPKDSSIHIDLHAGATGEGTMLFTTAHELTHFIRQWSPAKFKTLADFLMQEYGQFNAKFGSKPVNVDFLVHNQMEKAKRNGRTISYDTAYEEVIADSMESMLSDGNVVEKLAKLKQVDKSLWQKIKDFISDLVSKIRKVYEGMSPDSAEGRFVKDMVDSIEKLQDLFTEALVDASENYQSSEQVLAQAGITVNAETDSGSLLSVRDVLSDADRKKVAKALADRFNVTEEEALEWLKAETSLASLILNPKYSMFLDYEADPNEVAIKQNSDYPQGTVDFSNICKKRREFTQVMNRILRNFPNHVFAATDLARIRTIMGEEGMTLPCGICYVEDRRQLDTIVAQDFINGLKLYREGSKTRPDGKPFNANQLKGLKLTDGDDYVPSIYELVTLEGRNSLKAKNPNMEAAWVRYNNARGMQAVRLLTNEAEYKRQILKYNKNTVKSKNDHGGLRIYSFSDMEMFHLIDVIQVITDSSAVGLSIQGYTKVNEYAKAVKDTGLKLNRSLIPKGDLGYHMENGKVVLDYDTVEGIDIHSEDFFDSTDNPNVGNITIGINDTQIRAAMVSDFVDYIIPFHTGQSEEVLGEKGIGKWDNYKDFQTEKDLATGKTSSHQINIYTEVFQAAEAEGKPIQNKRQFVEKFLAVCKENGLKPRFAQFLNTDANGDYIYTEGYHKFLVDFKTFAQTEVGEYLPQMPVKPIFDDAYITGLLEAYVKEQQKKDAEVAKQMPKVIERITNEIIKPSEVKRSDRDSDGNQLSKEQSAFFAQSKVRDENGNLMVMYHGTNTPDFTVFDPQKSDDHISLFFTSDPDVANTYTQLQDKGRDVDPYNLITKDSSAEQFNKAQERVGGGLRVVKITPEWIQEMKAKADKSATRLFGVANKYADLLEHNNSTGMFNYDIERIREVTGKGIEKLTVDDINKLRRAMGSAEQHSFFATDHKGAAKEIRRIYHDTYKVFDEVWNYKTAAATPDSAIGQYTYTETNSSMPFMVTRDLDFLGHIKPKDEKGAVAQALERMKWVPEHNLGSRYKVYLNITNPYIIDAGVNYSGKMDIVSLERSTTGEGWRVSFENAEHDVINHMTTPDFMTFIESAFDAKTTAKIKAQIEADNEAYRKEWGDDFYEDMDVYHDIQLRDVYMNYMEPGNWNALNFNGNENARTRDVAAWAKEKGYDGVIFKNMKDAGGYAFMKGRGGSTVVTAFSSEQVKSVDNKSPTSDPDIRYSDRDYLDAVNRGDMETAQKMVDEAAKKAGYTIRGNHGTTHLFTVFDRSKGNPEGDFGKGFYFTTNEDDVAVNYAASDGGDLTAKIEQLAENMEWMDGYEEMEYEDRISEARRMLDGGHNRTIKAVLRISNPVVVGGDNETFFDAIEPYDEANDEYGEPTGLFFEFMDALREELGDVADYGGIVEQNVEDVLGEITGRAIDFDGMGAYRLTEYLKNELSNSVYDEDGNFAFNEVLRAAFERMGFDAIEDHSVSRKWGVRSGRRSPMVGVNDETTHYIVFASEQVKQADPVTYDDSGNVIPLSQRFNQANDDIRYSDRDTESVSNRSLLANAFEGVAQNDIERQKIQEYKGKIDLINAEERKLSELNQKIKDLSFAKGPKDTKAIRDLQFEAKQTANRISTYDKQLLRLEASKPLQDVLTREKKMAYQKAEQKGKKALAEYREKSAKTQRELITRYQDARKRGIESREKTAMRHKIKDVVNELNQYLLNGNKDKRVMMPLKKAVAEALDAVNMDTVGAEEIIAKLEAELLKAKTPEAIQEISRKIDHIRAMGDKMSSRLKALKDAYREIAESDDPLIANAHDDVIEAKLESVIEKVGNTPLRDMNVSQLEEVYDMYRMVLTTIRNSNKAFKAAKNESIAILGNRVMEEIDKVGGKRKYNLAAVEAIKKFGWNNLKPVYAFQHIGSDTFTEVFNNVRAGEDVWAVDVTEAREFYLDKARKYKYNSWNFDKRYTFTSSSGMNFSLNLEQIMSLYAYSKRDQAADHLKRGGIVIDESTEVTMKTKLGFKAKFNPTEATAYNISEETLAEIIGKLTEDQKQYVDEMQEYLSTVMGAKGNEVSLELYGIKLFKEKFYFPLKSASQFMAKAKEQQQGEVKIKNSGFSKETVKKASNPIVLTPFMNVWSNHVNEMSMYHAFVLPMEDFYRVWSYRTPTSDTMATESVEMFLQNAYGKGATKYIDQLLKDLNGGARTDSTTGVINKMMGLFKKGAVFASLSVVVQQPSAIARAAAIVDTKYFIGPKVDHKRHEALWKEVKKYAPVAIIKEMGYFDTNMGKSTQDFILGKEYSGFKEKMKALVTDSDFRDEALSKAPALADELAWCSIWGAVKRETKAKYPGLDVKGEPFLKLAGSRFTEVVTKTQVYDSVLARSANMRSKDTGMKMATAFMAEPTTSINMIADALLQGKRGNKKYARATIGAVIASQILNSILVSFVYAGRDDDEDETYWEKYIGTLSGEIIDSLNPATYIPFIKDIVSIVQGYDVERSDMAVISDLWNAYQKLGNDKVSPYRKVEGFAGSIAQIFGLPLKNIMRDVRGIYQTINSFMSGPKTTKAGIGYAVKSTAPKWLGGGDVSDQTQLYEAMVSGDKAHIARAKSRFKDQSAIQSAIRMALRENDPRIREAAIAWNANDLDEYMRIAKSIIGEKHFSQDDVVMAIRAEASKLAPDSGESTSTAKSKGLFTAEKFAEAIAQNDQAMAYSIMTDLVQTNQKNGASESDAKKSFGSSASSACKKLFLDGGMTVNQAENALVDYCGLEREAAQKRVGEWKFEYDYGYAYSDRAEAYKKGAISAYEMKPILMNVGGRTSQEADNDIRAYEWMKNNPSYDISVSDVLAYTKVIEDAGVSVEESGIDPDMFVEYRVLRSKCKGVDEDNDGTADRNSVKNEVLVIIDDMPITSYQKDVLYYLNGWAKSNLRKAPWH